LGVFVLHTVQMSMWVAVPAMLVQAGLPRSALAGLSAGLVLSFVAMGGLFAMERAAPARRLLGAIGLVLLVQIGLGMLAPAAPCHAVVHGGADVRVLLRLQRAGGQPAQPGLAHGAGRLRGAALGAYNTLQSLGLFAGGALGGALAKWAGAPACSPPRRCWRLFGWH
jgi:hypothetical protein